MDMEKQDDDQFERFLSAYPDYTRKKRHSLVPASLMERINDALSRARPSKEQWAKEFKSIKPVGTLGN